MFNSIKVYLYSVVYNRNSLVALYKEQLRATGTHINLRIKVPYKSYSCLSALLGELKDHSRQKNNYLQIHYISCCCLLSFTNMRLSLPEKQQVPANLEVQLIFD